MVHLVLSWHFYWNKTTNFSWKLYNNESCTNASIALASATWGSFKAALILETIFPTQHVLPARKEAWHNLAHLYLWRVCIDMNEWGECCSLWSCSLFPVTATDRHSLLSFIKNLFSIFSDGIIILWCKCWDTTSKYNTARRCLLCFLSFTAVNNFFFGFGGSLPIQPLVELRNFLNWIQLELCCGEIQLLNACA